MLLQLKAISRDDGYLSISSISLRKRRCVCKERDSLIRSLILRLEQSIKAEEAAMGTDVAGGTELEGGGLTLGGAEEPGGGWSTKS